MKVLNPKTNKPWRRGEVRDDSFIFWSYRTSTKNKDGFFRTNFRSPEKWLHLNIRSSKKLKKLQSEAKSSIMSGRAKKELNPNSEKWQFGDFYEGMYFINYNSRQLRQGRQSGRWVYPEAWHKVNVRATRQRTKDRAKAKNVPWELTTDYLLKIYPNDNRCPIFGVTMVWAGARENSPSLDRLVPDLGYVEGNVFWICWRANMIKSVGSSSEHRLVADWIDENS